MFYRNNFFPIVILKHNLFINIEFDNFIEIETTESCVFIDNITNKSYNNINVKFDIYIDYYNFKNKKDKNKLLLKNEYVLLTENVSKINVNDSYNYLIDTIGPIKYIYWFVNNNNVNLNNKLIYTGINGLNIKNNF
jgi:hypothetical protein